MGDGPACRYHHFLTQADVAASGAASVGCRFLDQFPLDVILQVLRLQVPHIVRQFRGFSTLFCTERMHVRSPGTQCTRLGSSLKVGIAVCSCSYKYGCWDLSLVLEPWCCGCALQPLTSFGTSAWPYRVITQYSYYMFWVQETWQLHYNHEVRQLRHVFCYTQHS